MRHFLVLTALITGISSTAFPEPCKAQPSQRDALVLGVAESVENIPVLIALEQGFYADEGLDITTKSWAVGRLTLEALLRNDVDVATVAETPIAMQSLQRRDFVVIATFSHDVPYRLVADRTSGILQPADFRGHRIGSMAGTIGQFFLHSVLADVGIAPGEITEVNVPAAESSEALMQKRVDAVAVIDPYGYYAQMALGDRAVLLPFDRSQHEQTFNYVTRRDFPRQRPLAAQRLLRATQRAIQWENSHHQEAVTLIAGRLKMDEKVLEALWSNYRHVITLDQALIISLEGEARWAIRNGLSSGGTVPNYLEFLDTSSLDAIMPGAVGIVR